MFSRWVFFVLVTVFCAYMAISYVRLHDSYERTKQDLSAGALQVVPVTIDDYAMILETTETGSTFPRAPIFDENGLAVIHRLGFQADLDGLLELYLYQMPEWKSWYFQDNAAASIRGLIANMLRPSTDEPICVVRSLEDNQIVAIYYALSPLAEEGQAYMVYTIEDGIVYSEFRQPIQPENHKLIPEDMSHPRTDDCQLKTVD